MLQARFYYKDKSAPQPKGNRIGACVLLEREGKRNISNAIEQKFLLIMKRSCILKSGGGDDDFVCSAPRRDAV